MMMGRNRAFDGQHLILLYFHQTEGLVYVVVMLVAWIGCFLKETGYIRLQCYPFESVFLFEI